MKIYWVIFNYQRKEMLLSLIQELRGQEFIIIDDGSDFELDIPQFHKFEHGGKPGFWKLWTWALRHVRDVHADVYAFIASDFSQIDFWRMHRMHEQFKRRPYTYNFINDGRLTCWNSKQPMKIDDETIKVHFTDCGFFCNRKSLELIGSQIPEMSPARFERDPSISSGVGQYLTMRMNQTKTDIYMPVKSIAFHGDHDSLMHPEHRKNNPLISK